ncbi:fatty acid hydroxylase domain-containing protein 2-like [Neocloeon triangulifer]|uniref:fatty acid hydroxylase domain-containing protein 2-like n=1 Tax=Neocloeon triangulifer TaxID=2078957 RepID=UPI00286F52B3|nr:fatty acid hydroxylase domain-containing protein 2-like [Neocloeon triangulifer]
MASSLSKRGILLLTISVYIELLLYVVPLIMLLLTAKALAPTEDYWETQWGRVMDAFGREPHILYGLMPSIISFVTYWVVALVYLACDLSGCLHRYKVQPGKNEPPPTQRLWHSLGMVLFNQLLVGAPYGVLAYDVFEFIWTKERIGLDKCGQLPSIVSVFFQLGVYTAIREITFYYSHRMMHHRWIYKHIHKQHHEWTAPIAMITLSCHPLEHLFGNIVPLSLGPVVLGSHPLVHWMWFVLVTAFPVSKHSGYHLPLLPSPEFHDYHHMTNSECFGNLGIMDALHGTDQKWRRTESFQRHFVMTGWKPIREMVKSATQ